VSVELYIIFTPSCCWLLTLATHNCLPAIVVADLLLWPHVSDHVSSLLQVTMAGDYILSIASIMIARLRSDDVTIVLSQVRKHCF